MTSSTIYLAFVLLLMMVFCGFALLWEFIDTQKEAISEFIKSLKEGK